MYKCITGGSRNQGRFGAWSGRRAVQRLLAAAGVQPSHAVVELQQPHLVCPAGEGTLQQQTLPPPHHLLTVAGQEDSAYHGCSTRALRGGSLAFDESYDKIIVARSSDVARSAMPIMSEAKLLQMRSDTMQAKIHDVSAAGYFAHRAWMASLLAHGIMLIRKGVLKPLFLLRYTLVDETPLTLRGKDDAETPQLTDSTPCPSELPDPDSDSEADDGGEKGVRKVIQSEAEVAALFWHTKDERYHEWRIPMPCHLQMGDRGTGEVLFPA